MHKILAGMKINRAVWAALLLLAPIAAAHASGAPMQFSTSQHCRAGNCTPIVVASGTITRQTYDRFTRHLASMDTDPGFIAFSSSGGNLGQALKMGVLIRALGLSTRVASGNDCLSACVYAFIGGISRTVDEGARMGVHQFSPESEDIQVAADDSRMVIEGVSRYTRAMNVSEHLSSLALMARPDQINLLTTAQVRMLGLDNSATKLAAIEFNPSAAEVRIKGSSLGSDRHAQFSLRPLPSQPGMIGVVSSLVEPGLYPRALMEKRMQSPAKLMVCPAPGMRLSTSTQCLFVPALLDFAPKGDGIYIAGFTVPAIDLLKVMGRNSHITLAAGPDGHAPLVSLALEVGNLPETILAMGSR